MNKWKVAVVIPVYNVENYLEESIESVINQTLGFRENIQLILVNDGSSDNSGAICEAYVKKYPENTVYVEQKNSGVATARNNGLKYVNAEYVNFLDSDDLWELTAFEKGVNALEKATDIDVACFRCQYFEATESYHMLDYRFKEGNRVIDVFETPEDILVHSTTAVIRTEAIGDIRFDESLRISEDTKFMYELVIKKGKYYAIADSKYMYRKREMETSALQTSRNKRYYYNDTVEKAHLYLMNRSRERFGEVIPFVQYFVMYEFQWRIKYGIAEFLTQEEKERYIDNIRTALSMIDTQIIAKQKNMSIAWKFLALRIKYGNHIPSLIRINEKNKLTINGDELFSFNKVLNHVTELEVQNDKLMIIGFFQFLCDTELYYRCDDGAYVKIDTYEMKNGVQFGDCHVRKDGFRVYIDISRAKNIEFYMKLHGEFHRLRNTFQHYSKINNVQGHYYCENGYLLRWKDKRRTICVQKNPSKFVQLFKEMKYLAILVKRHRKIKVACKRLLAKLYGFFHHKDEIWLFTDREFMARDNAEALYKYILMQPEIKNRKMYFVVNEGSEDYLRLKKYGNVVSYHTLKYELLFLNAKFLISSHADGYVNNPFEKDRKWYIDLFRFKYIYLTHGILLHDSSHWLTRTNKNFALNVTTSPYEYKSILNGYYYFEDWELLKTGMPRLDNLYHSKEERERKLLFMPSWRSSLAGKVIPNTQRRRNNPKFKESEYYCFYRKLLSDNRLLECLDRNNIRIKFCIHPSFRAQLEDFKQLENSLVEMAIDVDSQYEAVSSLGLVTDYSSAACDFAYLKKPVVYANFDFDHIYDVHYYNKSYFDYDENGFGPNATNYEDILAAIIKMVDNSFKVEEKYLERMDRFFFYVDGNNCQRVYDALLNYRKTLLQ